MPTFVHGISAELSVAGGTTLEGTLTSADMSLDRSLAEIKALAAGQVMRVAGLKDVTFTAAGAYDATVDAACSPPGMPLPLPPWCSRLMAPSPTRWTVGWPPTNLQPLPMPP